MHINICFLCFIAAFSQPSLIVIGGMIAAVVAGVVFALRKRRIPKTQAVEPSTPAVPTTTTTT